MHKKRMHHKTMHKSMHQLSEIFEVLQVQLSSSASSAGVISADESCSPQLRGPTMYTQSLKCGLRAAGTASCVPCGAWTPATFAVRRWA